MKKLLKQLVDIMIYEGQYDDREEALNWLTLDDNYEIIENCYQIDLSPYEILERLN